MKPCSESSPGFRGVTYATIASASAHVSNTVAMHRMLGGVPQADRIRTRLSKPLFICRWHEATRQSFWITSDGASVLCLTVSGLSATEMVPVWASVEDRFAASQIALSACTLREIIQTEVGITVDLVN